MNPGRELDALIQEEIFDMPLSKGPGHRDDEVGFYSNGDFYPLAPYSTDIAAAMEIGWKLREMKLYLTMNITRFADDQKFCARIEDQIGQSVGSAYSYNLAHAICLASLGAVKSASK